MPDYRYVAWLWLPWGILYANLAAPRRRPNRFLLFVLLAGIALHVWFTIALVAEPWAKSWD